MITMKQRQAAAKWDTGFAKPESKPPVAGSATGYAALPRTAKIRSDDMWRGESGHIYQVREWEVGKTVAELYEKEINEHHCTYLRKRHNAALCRPADSEGGARGNQSNQL